MKAPAFPLHDVVVTDDAFVHEAADPFEALGSWTPCSCPLARLSGEAAVVVGNKLSQHGVGGIDLGCIGRADAAGETILQHTPKTLHTSLGLRAVGGDEGDAQLFQGPAKLSRLAFSEELFFDRPTVVIADEDAAVITIESQRHAETAQQSGEASER